VAADTDLQDVSNTLSGGGMGASPVNNSLGTILSRRGKLEQQQGKDAQGEEAELRGEQKQLSTFEKDNPYPKPDIQPWTAKPPENDPLKSFGSWATGLSVLASALTKQPLLNALTAASASMSAQRAGELNAYKDAKDAWEKNMDLTIKNAEFEAKGYKNALDLMQTNWALGQAAWKAHATATQNQAAMLLGDAGIIEHQQQMAQGAARLAMEGQRVKMEGMKFAQEQQDRLEDRNYLKFQVQNKAQIYKEQTGKDPSPAEIAGMQRAARLDKQREDFSAAHGMGAAQGEVYSGGNVGGWSEDAVTNAAILKGLTNKDPVTGRGGAQSEAIRAAVNVTLARLLKEAKVTPEEAALMPLEKRQQALALGQDIKWRDGVARASDVVEQNMKIVKEYAAKLDLGTLKSVNSAILAGKSEFNDPLVNAYAVAAYTVMSEYARVKTGPNSNAQLTEGAQKDAATQLNLAMDTASFDEVSKVLTRDMENSIGAAEKMIDQRRQSLYSFGGQQSAPAASATQPAAAQQSAPTAAGQYQTGKTYVDAQGNKARWDGSKFVEVP